MATSHQALALLVLAGFVAVLWGTALDRPRLSMAGVTLQLLGACADLVLSHG